MKSTKWIRAIQKQKKRPVQLENASRVDQWLQRLWHSTTTEEAFRREEKTYTQQRLLLWDTLTYLLHINLNF